MPDPRPKPVPGRPLSNSLIDRVRATLASRPRAPRGAGAGPTRRGAPIASGRGAGGKLRTGSHGARTRGEGFVA
jgi:hypothetical protein